MSKNLTEDASMVLSLCDIVVLSSIWRLGILINLLPLPTRLMFDKDNILR